MLSRAIREPVLLILLSLAARPLHGYAILRDDVAHSDGLVRLSTGALYGAVRRLFPERLIKRVPEKGAPRGREAYRLTPTGRNVLRAEVARMRGLTGVAAL